MRPFLTSKATTTDTTPMRGVWILLGTIAATQFAMLTAIVQASSAADFGRLTTPAAWLAAIAAVCALGSLPLVQLHRRGIGAVRSRIRPASA